jgi:hypothetical protein
VILLLASGLLTAAGCGGPEFHPVRGTVTLDGTALPEASVTFIPESEEGTWGVATTDAEGKFTVRTGEQEGLLAGTYEVRITTYVAGNDQEDPPIPPVPEKVPEKYNARTTLKEEVKPGENDFQFDLSSEGEITQPAMGE